MAEAPLLPAILAPTRRQVNAKGRHHLPVRYRRSWGARRLCSTVLEQISAPRLSVQNHNAYAQTVPNRPT